MINLSASAARKVDGDGGIECLAPLEIIPRPFEVPSRIRFRCLHGRRAHFGTLEDRDGRLLSKLLLWRLVRRLVFLTILTASPAHVFL